MLNQWNLFQEIQLNPNTNFIKRYLNHFRWDQLFDHLFQKIGAICLLSLFFWVVKKIGQHFIRQTFNSRSQNHSRWGSDKRTSTLRTLAFNTFQYGLGFFWIYSILSVIGIPVGTLITSAGIFSLAIGLGAQGFVSDIVNGFFILFEKQLDVGEYVAINNIQGTVTAVGLRTTQVTSPEGVVNFIPNRNISIISNFSRNDMMAVVQIKISPTVPITKSFHIIQNINRAKAPHDSSVIGIPEIKGITTLQNGDPAIQIYIKTHNGTQFNVQKRFFRYYLEALRKAKVLLPNASA